MEIYLFDMKNALQGKVRICYTYIWQGFKYSKKFGFYFANYRVRMYFGEAKMKKTSLLILTLLVCIGLTAAASEAIEAEMNTATYRNDVGPYNLMAQVIGVNDVLLIWENPAYMNQPMGFRVYCNNIMVEQLSGPDLTDCLLTGACGGCHQLYVTALYDTGCESTPSNIVEIIITSNDDNLQEVIPLQVEVYPNPSRGNVQVRLSGVKNNDFVAIKVHNALGQLVSQSSQGKDNPWLWDGRNIMGRRVSQGVYFVTVTTSQGSVTRKLLMVK